jgi:hypothetical protein
MMGVYANWSGHGRIQRSLTLFDMTMIAIGGSIGRDFPDARDHRARRGVALADRGRSGCSAA